MVLHVSYLETFNINFVSDNYDKTKFIICLNHSSYHMISTALAYYKLFLPLMIKKETIQSNLHVSLCCNFSMACWYSIDQTGEPI